MKCKLQRVTRVHVEGAFKHAPVSPRVSSPIRSSSFTFLPHRNVAFTYLLSWPSHFTFAIFLFLFSVISSQMFQSYLSTFIIFFRRFPIYIPDSLGHCIYPPFTSVSPFVLHLHHFRHISLHFHHLHLHHLSRTSPSSPFKSSDHIHHAPRPPHPTQALHPSPQPLSPPPRLFPSRRRRSRISKAGRSSEEPSESSQIDSSRTLSVLTFLFGSNGFFSPPDK